MHVLSLPNQKPQKFIPVQPENDAVTVAKTVCDIVQDKDLSILKQHQKALAQLVQDSNVFKSELEELTSDICKVQKKNRMATTDHCLQYLVTVASDLSKLILHIQNLDCCDLKQFFAAQVPDIL